MKTTVVIAEDEVVASARVVRLLAEERDVGMAAECSCGREAIEAVAGLRDLLLAYLAEHGGSLAATRPYLRRLAIKSRGAMRVVRVSDVDWLETAGNYVRAHVGSADHLVRITAARLESLLDPSEFVRIHRCYIVNLDRIVEVQPWFSGDGVVILRTGAKLRLSRSYHARFHSQLLGASEP